MQSSKKNISILDTTLIKTIKYFDFIDEITIKINKKCIYLRAKAKFLVYLRNLTIKYSISNFITTQVGFEEAFILQATSLVC